MRPETLSLPTRESMFVGDDMAAMTRWFLSPAPAPPPVFFSPPQATSKTRVSKAKRRIMRLYDAGHGPTFTPCVRPAYPALRARLAESHRPRFRRRRRQVHRAVDERGEAAEPRPAARRGDVPAAAPDPAGADAGVVVDVLHRHRSRPHRHLRLPPP